jgi:diguanylate cyclase (GGDEF)-like protein/PAS domain S-box-containing protein
MMRRVHTFRPFAPRARTTIIAIVVTFAAVSIASAGLSIWSTGRSANRAAVVQVAARQRTLADRYVAEILLRRRGEEADPAHVGSILARSAATLLDGGTTPAVDGDDDETVIPAERDGVVRAQLLQQQRLVADLVASGNAYLAGRPLATVPLTAHEHLTAADPLLRVRVLAALTSNVSLDAARAIAARTDRNVTESVVLQILLGAGGILVSLLLAWGLVATTRKQTAHFRSLVTSSTDLVLVLSNGVCRYASGSVGAMVGCPPAELHGEGFMRFVHEDDAADLQTALEVGTVQKLVFRIQSKTGEWRHLEAHLTDLRTDRHVRGVVVNARDITERVQLEQELTLQARRDNFGAKLVEALEMADEEQGTYEVVARAMHEVSKTAPIELLLSDSSRAHLERVASNAGAEPPACPVESPFSCVAVRRGNPVVFESSEALNACPKLRDRPGGPCSAVCVPISFMGRSLGVLHATGPDGEPLGAEQVSQLSTLATQAGARIGTVRAFERTQLQASTDGLTGLINRRTLENKLRTLLRQRTPFALVLADLDRFKQLNDAHGHDAGDRSLRVFAQAVRRVLRENDEVARWGGEEFVIAMPGTEAAEAARACERIRDVLGRSHHGGHPPFTASFGVTDSTSGETLQQLLQIADRALYLSKEDGRDRVTIATEFDLPGDDSDVHELNEAAGAD